MPTINQYNIEAAHEFLIPRAIAYGAGLIDHFFRKVVQLEEADQGLGWVIRNLTSDTLTGEFRVYYDDKTSFDRVAVPNAAWTFSIEPHGARTVKFSRPANESGGYMLVFRGGVGNEVDLVAGHYGILPKFTIYRVGDEVIQQFPTEWLRCAWRDSTLRTVDFTYEVRHTWKGQQYTRMANGIVGTALDERFDLDCEVEVPPDGGHGADPYYRNQSTYTDWIDIVPCPSGSNQVFCGTTVTNGVLKYEWFISTQNELTDLRVITPIDLGIDAAMQGVIDDIRATGF